MLLKPTLLTLAFMSAALLGGCGKDEATKFCLSDEGTHQDCGIACTISKDQDACKKWEKMTIELCDKNEYACTKAKSM
jgi:major membrane immunogen (membrane-anchored lipoprotein)